MDAPFSCDCLVDNLFLIRKPFSKRLELIKNKNTKLMSMYRENCDRCHQPTNGVTIMSMYNEDVICMTCKESEKKRDDYKKAVDADVEQIKNGNYNFKGIGLDE